MKLRPVAVIDIGSNTIRSLIVEILPDGNYRVLDDEREVARLASGLSRRRRLSRDAIQRALGSLKRMAEIIRARGVRKIAVVADERAGRNAPGGHALVGCGLDDAVPQHQPPKAAGSEDLETGHSSLVIHPRRSCKGPTACPAESRRSSLPA